MLLFQSYMWHLFIFKYVYLFIFFLYLNWFWQTLSFQLERTWTDSVSGSACNLFPSQVEPPGEHYHGKWTKTKTKKNLSHCESKSRSWLFSLKSHWIHSTNLLQKKQTKVVCCLTLFLLVLREWKVDQNP